jgi:hypothetical protein
MSSIKLIYFQPVVEKSMWDPPREGTLHLVQEKKLNKDFTTEKSVWAGPTREEKIRIRVQVETIFNLAIMLPHLYPIMSFKMFHVKHYNLTEGIKMSNKKYNPEDYKDVEFVTVGNGPVENSICITLLI